MGLAQQPPSTPGIYPGPGQATLLRCGEQAYAFQNQLIAAGNASIAFQLERTPRIFYPWGVSAAIIFSAAPGAFEIDLQTADRDLATDYVTIASLTAVNANNAGRIELRNFWALYARLNVTTLTNSVNITALLTR